METMNVNNLKALALHRKRTEEADKAGVAEG